MARINLLPWREQLRAERQREFGFILVGALIISGLIGFYAWSHVEGLIDDQRARNKFLKDEIAEVDKQLKSIKELDKLKSNLVSRMKVIEQLQSSRPQIVHLFDELVTVLPEGVYLTDVKQSGSLVTLNGQAQSNARVSALMRNIDASEWLTGPKLAVAESRAGRQRTVNEPVRFTVSARQQQPGSDEQGDKGKRE
jgi:type IV pilus assembly protein PilN